MEPGIRTTLFILLILANKIGVRSTLFYGIVGIIGVWIPFLLSGVHATIAAVLVAFTIPATTKISEKGFLSKIKSYSGELDKTESLSGVTLTKGQLNIIKNEVDDKTCNSTFATS